MVERVERAVWDDFLDLSVLVDLEVQEVLLEMEVFSMPVDS